MKLAYAVVENKTGKCTLKNSITEQPIREPFIIKTFDVQNTDERIHLIKQCLPEGYRLRLHKPYFLKGAKK